MIKWIEGKCGPKAVPWVILTGWVGLILGGIAGTVFFAVTAVEVGLIIAIVTMIVGVFGSFIVAMNLDDKGYL